MLDKKNLTLALSTFFREKAEGYGIKMAFLYGSWAKGYPDEESDVDIAVLFAPDLYSDEFEIITEISLKLSTKLGKEVNILTLYTDFRKPMLYYNAIVLGIPLYYKEFEKYVSIKNQAIAQMEDFNIFGTKWQLEMTRRNLEELKYS